MTDGIIVQHPPAVKVGGRRLSISTKHKPHPIEPTPVHDSAAEPTDYPRPAAPGVEHPHQHPHAEEEVPLKKEKKHISNDNEKKLKEFGQWKAEVTRPTRDMQSGSRGFGAGGRIAQPAGKDFGI